MTKKDETRERVPLEEVVMSNVYSQEAIVNLLEKKGLLTKKEVLDEMRRLMVDDKKRKA
jgi:hypothetical protein